MRCRLATLLPLLVSALACVGTAAGATEPSPTEPDAADTAAGAGCVRRLPAEPIPPSERDTDAPNVELDQRTIISPPLVAFDDPVAAGEQFVCGLTIRNRRSERTTYELLPRGLVGARSGRTPARYLPADDPSAATTAASWLEAHPRRVTLEPRGVARVPVVVTVPEDPPQGTVAGAIEVVPAAARAEAGDTAVGIVSALAVPFLFTAGGAGAPELRLRDVRAPDVRWDRDPWTLRADLDNDGTLHATPRGRVRIRSIFGNTVASLPVAHPPLLPKGRQPVEVTWNDVPWFGVYRYDVRIAPAEERHEDEVARADGWFLAVPPWWVLAIAALVVALWIASRFRRDREDDGAGVPHDDPWDVVSVDGDDHR